MAGNNSSSPLEPAETESLWRHLRRSVGVRLALLLLGSMAVTFTVLGYLTVRHHRDHLEKATLISAERVSDLIERSTSYCMLRNDRAGLDHIIDTISGEPEVVRIRIFNQEGRVSLSTEPSEVDHYVDQQAEACYACHASEQPLVHLDRPDRFRIFTEPGGERILGIINPIENQPSCWEADCHAHPPEQKILGVLDTNLSLARADADVAVGRREIVNYTILAVVGISVLSGIFVWRVIHQPVRDLKSGTDRLAEGDLGYQIGPSSGTELGELASSFNDMSRQLQEAREENRAWTRTLESRVKEKTRELQEAHDHVVHVEKMASIGKLAATVAHEINNPLAGILTYAKLMRRWLEKGDPAAGRGEDMLEPLQLIESESRRCGDIVKNLLRFARPAPMNVEWVNLNTVAERCVKLVEHRMELAAILLHLDLATGLPEVQCDGSQMEQVILALMMNSVEALPDGGNLWIRTGCPEADDEVQIEIRDDGVGIPSDILPNIFEPFFSTKEASPGVGLGLAVSRGIVERHGGIIEVDSEPGQFTAFKVKMKVTRAATAAQPDEAGVSRQGDAP